jgi:methionyl-tRNA formyltransferase
VRTVYLGTSEFAADVLRRLAGSRHRPQLVVTPPDRPKGRGRRSGSPPTAAVAAELEIELLQAENVNEEGALERIRAARPDAVAVCAFGQLIREPLLSEWPLLNVHPSLLPRWRGAAPIERAIIAGDARTGVSLMQLTAGLDSGPVALREEIAIGPEDDFESLSGKLSALGGDLLIEALDLQAEGSLTFTEQDDEEATYAEKIDSAERRLDPGRPAVELARTVRALTPHVGAYLEVGGESRLGVRRARAVDVGVKQGVMKAEWGALLLGCGRGALRLEVVQPPGGKPMAADAYLRGHAVPAL